MKTKFLIIIFFNSFLIMNCKSAQLDDAGKIFFQYLELSQGEDVSKNQIFINKLEKITKIKGRVMMRDFGDENSSDTLKFVSKYEIDFWKKWYSNNKKNLKIDSEGNLFTDKNFGIEINASRVYLSYLKDLEIMRKNKSLNFEFLNSILFQFDELTGVEFKNTSEFGIAFPTEEEFKLLQKWYVTNKDNLYWDSKSSMIKVNNVPN